MFRPRVDSYDNQLSHFPWSLFGEIPNLWSLPEYQEMMVEQGFTNRRALGLVNFVPALAYHFCLNFTQFTQPGARLLMEPCSYPIRIFTILKSMS